MYKYIYFLAVTLFALNMTAQTYDIYVSDAGNYNLPPWQILKFDQNGDNPETFIDTLLNWPQDILFLEEQGVVLISNLGSGLINRHDAETGEYIDVFASGLAGPTRMAIGADGLLYVLQWNGPGIVLRFELDGTPLGAFTTVGTPNSIGLEWDEAGNLYVSSYNQGNVRRYSSTGEVIDLFISTNLAGPTNIWFDDEGDLLVVDYNGGTVDRFDSEGNFLGVFMTGLAFGEGIAFPDDETILIGNGNTGAVKKYTSAGVFVEDVIPSGSGDLITPNAVVLRNTSLGLEEVSNEISFLLNTTGVTFRIHSNRIQEVERVEVRDVKGSLIYEARPDHDVVWQADEVEGGSYFMTFFSSSDSLGTQKIQVIR